MILFLTSSPCGTYEKQDGQDVWEMSREYDFTEKLKAFCPKHSRWMIIAANPDEYEHNDQMAEDFFRMMTISGISVERMDLCDGRNGESLSDCLDEYDGIILGGGHVPTQSTFFEDIHLMEKISGYQGIVMGISAGTMNCAETVYSTPEMEGEATDPCYKRWVPGLSLTELMIIPHFQKARYDRIDGLRLMEDIALPDSYGHVFYGIPDGSYVLQIKGREMLYGEAVRISDGAEKELQAENGTLLSCRIQESRMTERAAAHDYLKEQLAFPEYYGKNLDALFDCLTEIEHVVVYYEREEGEDYLGIRDVFEEAAEANPGLILRMEE